MRREVLLDTGPLVAFLNRQDEYHEWAVSQWGQIAPPLWTCEAVISEACFLLGDAHRGGEAVIQLLHRGIIKIPFNLAEHVQVVEKLMGKYRAIPMSLADACLVRMSELYPASFILTLDSDFKLYRRNGRQVIPTLMPAGGTA